MKRSGVQRKVWAKNINERMLSIEIIIKSMKMDKSLQKNCMKNIEAKTLRDIIICLGNGEKANKSMLEGITKNRGREILRRGYCHKSQERRLFHKRERRENVLCIWQCGGHC